VVVEDLEEEADGGYEWGAVTVDGVRSKSGDTWDSRTYTGVALSACMSFMANLNRPPVLLPTISK
jgi:hypothetical protein